MHLRQGRQRPKAAELSSLMQVDSETFCERCARKRLQSVASIARLFVGTRSSMIECSTGSNNHLRCSDLFRSYIIEFNRSKDLDDTAPAPLPIPPFSILVFLWRQTWNLSKNFHSRIFRLKILHHQFHLILTVLVRKNTKTE